MDTYQILHNPRCSKSRRTLEILREHGVEPEITLYQENSLSHKEIQNICVLLKKKPLEITRTQDELFQELNIDVQEVSDEEILEILVQYPQLIERPIVIKNNSEAILGRPPENVFPLLI